MTLFNKSLTTVLLASTLFAGSAQADALYDILSAPAENIRMSLDGMVGARYFEDSKSGTQILQNMVTLRFAVDFNGKLQLVSEAMTGGHYKGGMNTFNSIEGSREPMQEIHIRRLFARAKITDNVTAEVGALAPTDGKGSLVGLGKMGWIDGARVTLETDSKEKIEVTAGRLSGVKDVDALERFREGVDGLDFIEVKISGKMFDKIAYQAGVERIEDENYAKVFVKKDIEVVAGHLVKLVGEGMVNLDTSGHKFRVGFETEIIKAFSKNSSGVILYADYLNTADDFGVHNSYVFLDGQGTGEKVRVGLKGTLSKKHKIGWYVNFLRDMNTGEFQTRTGFSMKFGRKAPKKPVSN